MINSENLKPQPLLLIVAGAKGAVASTVAFAVVAMQKNPDAILTSLTTASSFSYLGPPQAIHMAGWDTQNEKLTQWIRNHGVLPTEMWKPFQRDLEVMPIFRTPPDRLDLNGKIEYLMQDIETFKKQLPDARPVLINLLPATALNQLNKMSSLAQLKDDFNAVDLPDLAYVLAAVFSKIPVVNFTPNSLEVPVVIKEALKNSVPICGCDGKTGQTYFKVALASALKARSLYVDGWYSLNILGNADGKNLMAPERACSKVANKTELLDEILGYNVGEQYGSPSHKVHIDYYPPRGDAKEAWDVIDFKGMFGLPMSIRLNLQGRDSILAAPLVLDLARWMAVLKMSGRSGAIPELAFYFKKPMGENPPLSFQDQVNSLRKLEKECDKKCLKD